MAIDLDRHRRKTASPTLGRARVLVRLLIVGALFALAAARGYSGLRLAMLGIALLWALLLPVMLGWVWKATAGLGKNQRLATLVSVGLLLLVSFAFGVRFLLGVA